MLAEVLVVSWESCEWTGLRGRGRKMPSFGSWISAEEAMFGSSHDQRTKRVVDRRQVSEGRQGSFELSTRL